MKTHCFYLIAVSLVVLSACGEKRPVSVPRSHLPPEPLPAKETVQNDPAVSGSRGEHNPLLAAVRPVRRHRSGALARMIENAENQLNNQQPRLAFSILEQALYIDGQDPLVWHLMARARFDQGNIAQAISLAKKSNSLAAAYPGVKKKNAALLHKARGRGD